jgi:hypothetical protein
MYKERLQPHIKDYEGATVMDCYINPNIDYLDIPTMIARQRKAVQHKVTYTHTHVYRYIHTFNLQHTSSVARYIRTFNLQHTSSLTVKSFD